MKTSFKGYAASGKGEPLHPFEFDADELGAEQVEVQVESPVTELFPMSRVNDALDHLRAGKTRYRIVLRRDF